MNSTYENENILQSNGNNYYNNNNLNDSNVNENDVNDSVANIKTDNKKSYLPTVLDCSYYGLEDISIAKLISEIYNYINKNSIDKNLKFIINLPYNRLTDLNMDNMEIIKNYLLNDQRILYINLMWNYWNANQNSIAFIQKLDDNQIKKLILYDNRLIPSRLSVWNLTDSQLDSMIKSHIMFYNKYPGLSSNLVYKMPEHYNIVSLKLIGIKARCYLYCELCYKADICKYNMEQHGYTCSLNKSSCITYKYCRINKITHNNVPSKDILFKIVINNNLSQIKKLQGYPISDNIYKISKYIFRDLSEKWISNNTNKVQ